MIKNICTLLVLLLTLMSYGQNITLLQNTNPKANELNHGLNATKDSLILRSKVMILKVEIFNEDYEDIIIVEANSAQISLKNLPIGNFIIETNLSDKIIVMDLVNSNRLIDTSNSIISETIEGKGMMLDEELKVIKSSPNNSIEFLLTRGRSKNNAIKIQKFFWTETQINNESGSSKTMKLADQRSVDEMIKRHQLEVNSDTGKLNKLTVWEVYNTGEFMENQVSNPDFVYSSSTDLFNTTPYYTTNSKAQNL